MRDVLPEFYPPRKSTAEFVAGATIVLDSNVLLSLYRWSPTTRGEAISVLEAVADRLWFPHQVVKEYLANREEVAKSLRDQYRKALSTIDATRSSIIKHFDTGKRYQESRERVDDVVSKALEKLRGEIEELRDGDDAQIDHEADDILELVERLSEGRIGERPSPKVLRERLQEFVEHRLPLQIPPGYEDRRKEGVGIAGDFLIWCEILDHAAKHSGTPVLFVTDDTKSDWYEGERGARSGPRRELVAEFAHYSTAGYHQTAFDRFLLTAKKHLDIAVAEETVEEVRTDAEERRSAARQAELETLRRVQNGAGSFLPQAQINRILQLPAMHAHFDIMGQAMQNPALQDTLRRAAGLANPSIDPRIFSSLLGLKGVSDAVTSNFSRALREASRDDVFDDDAGEADESPTIDDLDDEDE